MKKIFSITLIAALLTSLNSCKKDDPKGPNDLGGETNIELTQVGNESSVYINVGGINVNTGTITVIANNDGIVTYHGVVDLTGHPDSALISALVPAEYKTPDGKIEGDFNLKITSEGVQDFMQENKPWTVVKYADGVGAEYPFTNIYGETSKRTVTEKTGQDDWPMGFLYIKTSKVEHYLPESDQVASKITYRANHKFGLVYIEVELKNGSTATMDIFPWFML